MTNEPKTPASTSVPSLSGVILPHEDGQRLDRWCKKHWPDVPHGLLQKSARKGALRLDGTRAKPDTRVVAGQAVTLRGTSGGANKPATISTERPGGKTEEQMRRMVILVEPQLYVLNKPAGIAVQGGSGQSHHIDGMLDALQGNAPERPKLVHRLDRDTSGVLLIARDGHSATALTKAFAKKDVQKVYWAIVLGTPKKSRGKITLTMAKGAVGDDKEKMMIMSEAEGGMVAETHYRVIGTRDYLGMPHSWVELMPVTGRTHQLRVHMQAIGHPILGDVKYGGPGVIRPGLAPQMHLHARRLIMGYGVATNIDGIDVKAPLSEHFRDSLKKMGFPKDDDGVSLVEVGL